MADCSPTHGKFHSSWAKNTAHRQAMEIADVQQLPNDFVILVNLDCDNTIGANFIGRTLTTFSNTNIKAYHARGWENATTGRIAIRMREFQHINGYDQEDDIQPSGYQDIDLVRRVEKLGNIKREKNTFADQVDAYECIGCAIPNDLSSIEANSDTAKIKANRDTAKIKNCHNPRKLTWGRLLVSII